MGKWNFRNLEQGLENYGLWLKFCGLLVFKFLLEHNHTHSFMYCPWLVLCKKTAVELFQQRQYSLKYLLSGQRKSLPTFGLESGLFQHSLRTTFVTSAVTLKERKQLVLPLLFLSTAENTWVCISRVSITLRNLFLRVGQ